MSFEPGGVYRSVLNDKMLFLVIAAMDEPCDGTTVLHHATGMERLFMSSFTSSMFVRAQTIAEHNAVQIAHSPV